MVPAVYSAGQPASLPVAIDYPAALALRQMSMVHDELPKYLLAPEVSALLHYVPDLHRKMLLATLWNTGARINEALALTRGDFSLAPPYPFVQLATLKQRTEKAARTAGRMPAGQQTHRLVPLSDSWYVSQLQTMVATLKIPMAVSYTHLWQLAVQLGNSGFIRPPKLTHADTRIRIEPFFNAENEYD